MRGSLRSRIPGIARAAALVVVALVLATAAVSVLESAVGVPDASAVYFVAVVLCGVASGTWAAIAAAFGAFLIYNYFFTPPLYTFTIADPRAVLSVVLLLFVGIVVGQLAAMQRSRAEMALSREREARAAFGVSRILATRESTERALGQIAEVLCSEAGLQRVWVGFGPEPAKERITADTAPDRPRRAGTRVRILQRKPGEDPATWTLVMQPGPPSRGPGALDLYRVRIEASGEPLGSIWAERDRSLGEPDRTQTRLLAAAADQIGQAVARDRIAEEAKAAELARQGDALKTSLLQSVSHDFRTPLAVIRAAAGSLDSDSSLSAADRHANTQAIEREVEYLNALVANLLDMSRIEAGVLRPDLELYDLDDALTRAIDRVRPRLGDRQLELAVDPVVVRVDAVFLDASVANVLDNALKYTPPDARIRVATTRVDRATVRLSIEDSGPGVADNALPRLFDKFYRVPGARGGSRGGLGIGLAVVRGLIQATGGHVTARRSDLGGLAIDLELPLAAVSSQPATGGTP
jgi:two-component system sensor histidine kinase KdpD